MTMADDTRRRENYEDEFHLHPRFKLLSLTCHILRVCKQLQAYYCSNVKKTSLTNVAFFYVVYRPGLVITTAIVDYYPETQENITWKIYCSSKMCNCRRYKSQLIPTV